MIDAYLSAIDFDNGGLEIFNIASGVSYSVREVANMIKDISIKSIDIQFTGEKRPRDVYDTVADITRARNLLHWKPEFDLQKGLIEMISQDY